MKITRSKPITHAKRYRKYEFSQQRIHIGKIWISQQHLFFLSKLKKKYSTSFSFILENALNIGIYNFLTYDIHLFKGFDKKDMKNYILSSGVQKITNKYKYTIDKNIIDKIYDISTTNNFNKSFVIFLVLSSFFLYFNKNMTLSYEMFE